MSIDSPEQIRPVEQKPIQEDEASVSYLGVRLEKASADSALVPKRESYRDYINDEFSLKLQQKIAVCLDAGDPILIEGGTSIGKTTTVRKMAAELGYEVYYINLTGATDVEDLMGRYVPNVHRKDDSEPEYIFADGKVTAALRQEDGKKKILLLDELGATPANILIRLHEVLDALERNGDVVLSEDASETVSVSKGATKVVGLTNTPGKGFSGREPLDRAQLRRWVYQKEVDTLPASTFKKATLCLFGLEHSDDELPPETYLHSQESPLSDEQLAEIPGIAEILAKYQEFHQAANQIVKNRQIAKDQPQQFFYDDRMEPRRVRDFIQRYYNGDINGTFQRALQYYYGGKLETAVDRQKLDELISHVSYVAPTQSRRRSLDPTAAPQQPTPASPEAAPSPLGGPIGEQVRLAQEILGEPNVLGREAVEHAFGRRLLESEVPAIPFSRLELENAKRLGQRLRLRIDKASDGQSLSMKKIYEIIEQKLQAAGKGKLLSNTDWYQNEEFFTQETPGLHWALTTPELVPDTTSKNYLQQTDALIKYLTDAAFQGMALPPEYAEAIREFTNQRPELESLLGSNWQEAAKRLAELKITSLVRPSEVEAAYDLALTMDVRDERLLERMYTWTRTRSSSGSLVSLGGFDAFGADVGGHNPDLALFRLGGFFSRSR